MSSDWRSLTSDGGVTLRVTKKAADGAPACNSARRAKVAYEGRLVKGDAVFDSSMGYAIWFDLAPGKLVDGFLLGLQALHLGEEADIKMEAQYGYGDKKDLDGIPPGSALQFTVRIEELDTSIDPSKAAASSKETLAQAREAGLAASQTEQARRAEKQAEVEARKAAAAARAAELAAKRSGGGKGGKKKATASLSHTRNLRPTPPAPAVAVHDPQKQQQ